MAYTSKKFNGIIRVILIKLIKNMSPKILKDDFVDTLTIAKNGKVNLAIVEVDDISNEYDYNRVITVVRGVG